MLMLPTGSATGNPFELEKHASLLPPAVREGREPSLYIDDSALASFQQNDNGNGNGNGNGMYIVLFNLARFKIAMIGRSQL